MFRFKPADFVPYKNKEVLDYCRKLSGEDLTRHKNPDFKIRISENTGGIWISDMVMRIQRSDLLDEKVVMILPNPCPGIYMAVADAINMHSINCRNVYIFTMDEWADEDGKIAPETYRAGFSYSNKKYFVNRIDPELRMPDKNIVYPTTKI
jgi:hypothetical protein